VYDRRSGAWRAIANGPFQPALFQPSGVAINGTLIVVGTPCDDLQRRMLPCRMV
jgi:hypothetical protein